MTTSANGPARCVAGFLSAHAGGQVLVNLLFEMEAQLGIELLLDAPVPKKRA